MPRYGMGFPAGRRRRLLGGGAGIDAIQPGASWTGVAASGFATPPTDPARTTAKPAMQLLEPPSQFFTESKTIGVLAMANNGGSLLDNLGLSHVRVHYEGTVHDIAAPSLRRFTDVNGVERAYLGWWITLEHNGIDGEAQVYFEAVPKDTTMQSRVMGPYSFYPAATLYDYEIEVAASLPEIAGSRYPTVAKATAYLVGQGATNPRVTITEGGDYDLVIWHGGYQGDGYCTVEASAPVTFKKPPYAPGLNAYLRPRWDGMWFKGGNITFDFADAFYIYHESAAWRQHVFEGVNFTDSGGRASLWLKGARPTPYIARDNPYYLECDVEYVQNAFLNASLVRGCHYRDGASDAFSYARCVAFSTLAGHHDEDWRTPIDALTMQYVGSAASATIEMSGGSDTNNRVLTLREDGAVVSTFTVKNAEADYAAGTNYDVADVVAWINAQTDWSATLLDDTRRATALSHDSSGTLGSSFAAVDAKSGPVTLHTVFDPHGDVWAMNNVSYDNGLFFANQMHSNYVPAMSFAYTQHRDLFFVNNTFETDEALNPWFFNMISQWSKPSSHVVIAHNSFANHRLLVRPSLGMTADAYCLLANNTMSRLQWEGTPDPVLPIVDNHLHSGSSVPSGATGTTTGGDNTSLFADAANGDFTPAGDLLTNKKPPRVKRDINGKSRGGQAPPGALA